MDSEKTEAHQPQNHLAKHHLGYLHGPILFTAPHSKSVYRGGEEYKEEEELHKREKYASWIAVELAHKVRIDSHKTPHSFCVWGKAEEPTHQDRDPNYLLEEMFEENDFHQALHAWARKNDDHPLLHIDIHGKSDREECLIDVGIKSIEKHWSPDDPLVERLTNFFHKFAEIFEDTEVSDCKFNLHGEFQGYWLKLKNKPKRHSMTEQAIQLGIPSFQMQIPKKVRKELFSNKPLRKRFAKGLSQLYEDEIKAYYSLNEKKHELKVKKSIANKFNRTIQNAQQAHEVRDQLREMQS